MGKRSRRRDRESGVTEIRAELKRLKDMLEESISVLDQAMIDPNVRVSEVVSVFLDLFDIDPRQDEAGFYLVSEAPAGRPSEIADELVAQAPESLAALTFAAGVADAEGNHVKCAELYERALDVAPNEDSLPWLLALSLFEAGRVADGLEIAEELTEEEPADELAIDALRDGLVEAKRRLSSMEFNQPCTCGSGADYGQCCAPRERVSLNRFLDRGEFDQVLAEIRTYAAHPSRRSLIEAARLRWFPVDVEEPEALHDEAFLAWTSEVPYPAPVRGHEDECVLMQMPDDLEVPEKLREAVEELYVYGRWGLWQVSGFVMDEPGYFLTELISGSRIYASLARDVPVHPWGILLGWMAPMGGIWRSTPALFSLSPEEGQMVGGHVIEWMSSLLDEEKDEIEPEIELPELLTLGGHPMPRELAVITSMLVHVSLPELRAMVEQMRRQLPTLTNTDAEPLRLLRLEVNVGDRGSLERALDAHPDFDQNPDGFTWLGKEMSKMQVEASMEEARRFAKEQGVELSESDAPHRWVRGNLTFKNERVIIEVNSEARRDAILEVLRGLGIEATLEFQSSIDPSMDFALPTETPPAESKVEATEPLPHLTWGDQWLDEEIPALGGLTPREAADDEEARPYLEGLLRSFEYRASVARSRGRPAPDVAKMRTELGM